MVSRPSQQKRSPQIPDGGWPAVSVDSDFESRKSILDAGGVSVQEAKRSEKKEPCRFVMERLREQFGLEFIYAKLSERGRTKVMSYSRMMLEWEEAGPKKVREIDRILAKKVPGLLSQKFPVPGGPEASPILDADADEFDDVADLTTELNGHHSPEG